MVFLVQQRMLLAATKPHQPYALVHRAFFLNSGRALKDSRVAKGTKHKATVAPGEAAFEKVTEIKTVSEQSLAFSHLANLEALGRILMVENH